MRCKKRRKDGKEHHYWSIVENRRVMGGRVLQRHVLYLGEIHRLNERHDKILEHKTALFDHLTERWRTLFDAKFEVLSTI